jgi:hypothetical protein
MKCNTTVSVRTGLCCIALHAWLGAMSLSAQTPAPSPYILDEVRHLIGIQNRMRTSLEQLPNHTCRLEIRRAHLGVKARAKIAKKMAKEIEKLGDGEHVYVDIPLDAADVVALEVAIIDGEVLYAFPDSSRFEDRPLTEMIGHGTVSTGSFVGHARNIFVNGAAVTKYIGEELLDGKQMRRYDYEVELFRSRYSVTNKGQTATVPYHGSFWATVESDELRRLTFRADDIPYYVGIDEFSTQVDYWTLQLNSEPFIAPRRARLTMLLSTGVESVNETEYTDCRSFVGSSTLSFDDSTSQFYVEKVEEIEDVDLPVGLRLPVRLTSMIDSETARVGTPVTAELAADVEYGPNAVVQKGAVLNGRLRRFELYEGGEDHHVVGIEFFELSFDAGRKHGEISLSLEQVAGRMGVRQGASAPTTNSLVTTGLGNSTVTRTTVETYIGHNMPGVGIFYVRGRKFRLKPGLRMTWRTVAASSPAEER